MSNPTQISPPKCEQCGALASRLEARFCEYCGVELPKPIAPPPLPVNAAYSPLERNQARFLNLKRHPDTSKLNQVTPSGAGQAKHLMPILGVALTLVFGIFVVSQMNSMGSNGSFASTGRSLPMQLDGMTFNMDGISTPLESASFPSQSSGFSAISALFIGILGLIGLIALFKFAKFNSAPILKHAALVLDKRVKVTGGHGDHSANTSYFVSLEFEDGGRQEYPALEAASVQALPQDMGIAYLRDGMLVEFGRVPV